MAIGLSRHTVSLDLFTDAYRVTGQAQVGVGGIQAELGNPNTDYLELTDAYVSRIYESGDIIANYKSCAFRKENINFLVLQDRRDGVAIGTSHARSVYTRGRPVEVFLAVPAFEIRGQIMHEGQLSPSNVLVNTPGRFQPVYEATARASLYPDIDYGGDLILVQKARIAICGLDSSRR